MQERMKKNDVDEVDQEMLPGFRFHPTDEELVGFYLIRKIQQQPLPIELIKQVDIYKYDPWDLPKLASNGEKEWYFYCPRDRKYRNSARPNRVTEAGFWKATGTDRPIYSSDHGKCIGLKKSLVFYRGRASKGIKTDWMMHEFRLPSLSNSLPSKKVLNKSFPASDAWAICRIFKKTSTIAQRGFPYSWMAAHPEATVSENIITHSDTANYHPFSSETISCTAEIGSVLQFCGNSDLQQASSTDFSGSDIDILPHKLMSPTISKPSQFPASDGDFSNSMEFSEVSEPYKSTMDGSSILFNPVLTDFDRSYQQIYGFSDIENHENDTHGEENDPRKSSDEVQVSNQCGIVKHIGFPFSLSPDDAWKSLTWDSANQVIGNSLISLNRAASTNAKITTQNKRKQQQPVI